MERIKTATRFIDKFGPGMDGFTDGNPTAGAPSTQLEADWFDQTQEEIARAIELSGIALDPADMTQLWQAIRAIAIANNPDLTAYVLKTGDTMTGPLVVNAGRIVSTSGAGTAASVACWVQGSGAYGMWTDGLVLILGATNTAGTPTNEMLRLALGTARAEHFVAESNLFPSLTCWIPATATAFGMWTDSFAVRWGTVDPANALPIAQGMMLDPPGNLTINQRYFYDNGTPVSPLATMSGYEPGAIDLHALRVSYIDNPLTGRRELGLVRSEVAEVAEELVARDREGNIALDLVGIEMVILAELQSAIRTIDQLAARVMQLERRS